VKTGRGGLSVVQVNFACDKSLADPDQLLDRYATLTGWSDALAAAGAARVAVVQRFHRDAHLRRGEVDYFFRRAGLGAAAAGCRPDVAHVNGLEFAVRTWGLRRALAASAAVVVQSHGDGGPVGRSASLRMAARAARRAADAFLFAAPEHADPWRRAGVIAADQPVHCVMEASTTMQPFDQAQGTPSTRTAAREASGVSGSPAMLWVGRLNANKDPLTVLDAVERCAADLPDATLTMIYGTDELLAPVRERVERSAALRDRVRLLGAVPHDRMAAFFTAADIFVLGSHHEGSGYSLMEACACGAIPVVTDIPTFRVLTARGAVGALWTAGDAESCARALVDAARRDPDVARAKLADHVARELTWDAVGRRALAIYEQVIAARRAAVG
jgi:glycosyltransferase involved in cell wall biosynthesis